MCVCLVGSRSVSSCVASLVGLRSVLSRVFLSCWVEVGFIMCVIVLLGRGRFDHVCDCLVGLRSVLSCVCLSCWVEVGFITCVFVLLG